MTTAIQRRRLATTGWPAYGKGRSRCRPKRSTVPGQVAACPQGQTGAGGRICGRGYEPMPGDKGSMRRLKRPVCIPGHEPPDQQAFSASLSPPHLRLFPQPSWSIVITLGFQGPLSGAVARRLCWPRVRHRSGQLAALSVRLSELRGDHGREGIGEAKGRCSRSAKAGLARRARCYVLCRRHHRTRQRHCLHQ